MANQNYNLSDWDSTGCVRGSQDGHCSKVRGVFKKNKGGGGGQVTKVYDRDFPSAVSGREKIAAGCLT